MKKVLKSKTTYKDFLGRDYSIVIDVEIIKTDKVLATLRVFKEIGIEEQGQKILVEEQLWTPLIKIYELSEITTIQSTLNLTSTLNFVEVEEQVKLKTVLHTIDDIDLFIVDGKILRSSDFEVVEITMMY